MKKISLIVSLLLIISMTMFFTSCNDEKPELSNSWDVPDYATQGEIEDGLSALTVFNEALQNYYDAENMVFIRSMDFDAGAIATQQTIDITKFNGDLAFTQGTKQGTVAGKSFDANRFYYDGTNAYQCPVRGDDAESRFPALGTENWEGLTYSPYDDSEKSVETKLTEIRNFTLYVINQDTLADSHDDKVYELDDKYYICLTIDCMGIEEDTTQKVVEEDIMRGLGDTAKPGTFEWVSDTKLYLEITEIDGEYYITARSLQENYKAVQTILPVTCVQVTSGTYSYDAEVAQITAAEKMDKA